MGEQRKRKTELNEEIKEFINSHPELNIYKVTKLQQAWEKIASKQELEHTDNIARGKDAKNKTILVFTDSSHWAAEMSMSKELYRIMLEKELNEEIDELKFLINKRAALKKMFEKEDKQKQENDKKGKPIKLTKEEDRHTRDLVSQVKNEKLKLKLYSAIKADFEWKKGKEEEKLP